MNHLRLLKLNKVEDKYNYRGMEFPTSYEGVSTLGEINGVCILIYALDSEGNIRPRQNGRLEHRTDDLFYLLRLETANNIN